MVTTPTAASATATVVVSPAKAEASATATAPATTATTTVTTKVVKSDIVSICFADEDDIVDCICSVESFKGEAYKCGNWLVGYGQSRVRGHKVTPGTRISRDEAKAEMREYLKGVYRLLDTIKLRTPEQYIACCMIAYSTGNGGFAKSAFAKAINSGKTPEECVKVLGKGQYVGVHKRRWLEAALFTGQVKLDDIRDLDIKRLYDIEESFYLPNGVKGDFDLSEEKVQAWLDRMRA